MAAVAKRSRPAIPLGMVMLLIVGLGSSPAMGQPQVLMEAIGQVGELRASGRFLEARATLESIAGAPDVFQSAPPYLVGEYGRTAATLDSILAMTAAAQRDIGTADSLTAVVFGLYDERRFEEGAALARRQLEIRERLLGADHVETWESRNQLAMMLEETDQVVESLELLEGVVAANRRLLEPDHPALDISMSNLATMYDVRGEFARAETLYRASLAIAREHAEADPLALATTLNNLGTCLSDQGEHGPAEPLLREALELRRAHGEDGTEIAQSENNLAALLDGDGRTDEALPLFRSAIARRESLGQPGPELAAMRLSYGKALYQAGRYAEAEREYASALALREATGAVHPARLATAVINHACAVRALGRVSEARVMMSGALATLQSVMEPAHPDLIWARRQLGETEILAGRWAAAESCLVPAAGAFESARRRARPGQARVTFQASPYPLLALLLVEQNKGNAAWAANERWLGRGLVDQLAFESALSREPAARSAVARLRLLTARAQADYEDLVLRDGGGREGGAGASAAHRTLERREAELNRLLLDLERTSLERGDVEEVSLADVQAAMLQDEAIVGWLDARFAERGEAHFGYVVRSSGPVRWERLPNAPAPDGQTSVSRYRDALRLGRDESELAGVVAALRWAPLLSHLEGVRHLVVIPAGDMLGIPLEPLAIAAPPSGGRPVIRYEASATLFVRSRRATTAAAPDGRSEAPPILAFCDPPHSRDDLLDMRAGRAGRAPEPGAGNPAAMRGGILDAQERAARTLRREDLRLLPRLANSRSEGECLRRLGGAKARVFDGPECSELELRRLADTDSLSMYRVVHFGTHALVNDRAPERSALVLSQVDSTSPAGRDSAAGHDGVVTVREILAEWRLDADLVTLSACATGLGRAIAGEGYVGFAQALRRVGARSVLVSLWNVDDRSTALLIQRFYENWAGAGWESPARAAALDEAKSWLRAGAGGRLRTPHDHPYYWAGFVLIGE